MERLIDVFFDFLLRLGAGYLTYRVTGKWEMWILTHWLFKILMDIRDKEK